MKYACGVVLCFGIFLLASLLKSPKVDSWPQLPRETLGLEGIQGLMLEVDSDVAYVITDARLRKQIIQAICSRAVAVQKAQEDLFQSVQARIGTSDAIVPVGSMWVRKK